MVLNFQNHSCIIWIIMCAYEYRDRKISAFKPCKEQGRRASMTEDRLPFK